MLVAFASITQLCTEIGNLLFETANSGIGNLGIFMDLFVEDLNTIFKISVDVSEACKTLGCSRNKVFSMRAFIRGRRGGWCANCM